ncbi:hypothetical protein PTSG_05941 [Salpingoeca rosetta]|uniref:Uncharacterized protein n=1 Tax=Salpingoeca rosetta (strain ATCC 50818 / BSB-021) TaxID=946362 RepID=F2UD81_SALR5|nr:uncharacterized protein PTSG_05941 [Salpingoeca rosetta]EGD74576.1 hypothetical protein PTSG_05941 [Salpingoeca rosetta]|eukprot:XP_004992833.1 hypothetical protein PTSG_05941 [Salpingoeca rosetta]
MRAVSTNVLHTSTAATATMGSAASLVPLATVDTEDGVVHVVRGSLPGMVKIIQRHRVTLMRKSNPEYRSGVNVGIACSRALFDSNRFITVRVPHEFFVRRHAAGSTSTLFTYQHHQLKIAFSDVFPTRPSRIFDAILAVARVLTVEDEAADADPADTFRRLQQQQQQQPHPCRDVILGVALHAALKVDNVADTRDLLGEYGTRPDEYASSVLQDIINNTTNEQFEQLFVDIETKEQDVADILARCAKAAFHCEVQLALHKEAGDDDILVVSHWPVCPSCTHVCSALGVTALGLE